MKKYNYEEAIEIMKKGGIVAIPDVKLNSLNRCEVYKMIDGEIVDMQGLKIEIGINKMYREIKVESKEMILADLFNIRKGHREYFFKLNNVDYFLRSEHVFKIDTVHHENHFSVDGHFIHDNKWNNINYIGFSVKGL